MIEVTYSRENGPTIRIAFHEAEFELAEKMGLSRYEYIVQMLKQKADEQEKKQAQLTTSDK